MLLNLVRDVHLRGAIFEDVVRILLRRNNKNNFVFRVCNFDSLQEIVEKYRLNTESLKDCFAFFAVNRCLCDLVEFVLDNTNSRTVVMMNFYEVKTKRSKAERKYLETCVSNHEFMLKMKELGFGVFVVSCVLFEDWRYSFNVYTYDDVLLRVYDSVLNKTVLFTKRTSIEN